MVSENNKWRQEFIYNMLGIAEKYKKEIKIVEPNYITDGTYEGIESVVDMFSLSKCKKIYQGVKYSTFSILASLLGNGELINYAKQCESYETCLIHSWGSVCKINGKKDYNEEIQKKVCEYISDIHTN